MCDGICPLSFFHRSRFHAQANPELNRVGRKATFHTRPLTYFFWMSVGKRALPRAGIACLEFGR